MEIGVEISLYPLNADYIPPIQLFIDRLNAKPGLRIQTNSMSTQIFGDYDRIMALLTRELRETFASNAKAVFVMKLLGPLTATA
jgi:uncharacterized protein YqgV (UPF0045/DUF77 family)